MLLQEASDSPLHHSDRVHVNQGIPPGTPRPAQAFAPQGPYPAGHLPGGASPPRPPAGPPPLGFGQYPPPGSARPPQLPYGAQNDAAPPQPALFGLATPGSGVGFQPQSGACLQGGREPPSPTTRLGSRQAQEGILRAKAGNLRKGD
ncbi:hypothetical protein HPB50_011100 [Hyalomma asiaticum]|uniref:Uncharacterized protein n=1 Tax=Hyalomma asiaticum TaxID=266040 RepID=A0ACB7SG89_HYAAI|nr:hypothetical protein HPB50_011100 [Hyalomma asiaticum]